MTNRIVGAVFIMGWNIVWTSLIMCFIKYVLRIPLRMTEEQLLGGDGVIHGEAAYVLGRAKRTRICSLVTIPRDLRPGPVGWAWAVFF